MFTCKILRINVSPNTGNPYAIVKLLGTAEQIEQQKTAMDLNANQQYREDPDTGDITTIVAFSTLEKKGLVSLSSTRQDLQNLTNVTMECGVTDRGWFVATDSIGVVMDRQLVRKEVLTRKMLGQAAQAPVNETPDPDDESADPKKEPASKKEPEVINQEGQ